MLTGCQYVRTSPIPERLHNMKGGRGLRWEGGEEEGEGNGYLS